MGGVICLIAMAYLLYYLLLKDKLINFCVDSSISLFHHWHCIAIGLIPIYLALIIFGATIVSIQLGSALQRWLAQLWQR